MNRHHIKNTITVQKQINLKEQNCLDSAASVPLTEWHLVKIKPLHQKKEGKPFPKE